MHRDQIELPRHSFQRGEVLARLCSAMYSELSRHVLRALTCSPAACTHRETHTCLPCILKIDVCQFFPDYFAAVDHDGVWAVESGTPAFRAGSGRR